MSQEQNISDTPTISIWDPNVAAILCYFLTPAFGPYIQMLNWQSLQQPEKAAASKTWFLLILAFPAFVLLSGIFWPNVKAIGALPVQIWLGIWLSWYFTSGREQVRYVKEQLGTNYVKKSWNKPLRVAIAIYIALIVCIWSLK